MRKSGYYWVVYGGNLQVAYCFGNNLWNLIGAHYDYTDDSLEYISEEPLSEPAIPDNVLVKP